MINSHVVKHPILVFEPHALAAPSEWSTKKACVKDLGVLHLANIDISGIDGYDCVAQVF